MAGFFYFTLTAEAINRTPLRLTNPSAYANQSQLLGVRTNTLLTLLSHCIKSLQLYRANEAESQPKSEGLSRMKALHEDTICVVFAGSVGAIRPPSPSGPSGAAQRNPRILSCAR